jgi:AcrR family transcriptional regulator
MGRPHNADGGRTRQAILDAALKLFAARGYFGTSLRNIATAVSIRESALYNYFASKESLFEALILADRESNLDLLSTAVEDPITDVRKTLTRLCSQALVSFAKPQQRQLFRIFMSDGIRLAKEGRINSFKSMSKEKGRVHELMRHLVRDGWLRPAEPQVLAMAFIGPLLLWRQLHALELNLPAIKNPQAFARQHVDQFLQGAAVRTIRRSPRPVLSDPRATTVRRARGPRASSTMNHTRSNR